MHCLNNQFAPSSNSYHERPYGTGQKLIIPFLSRQVGLLTQYFWLYIAHYYLPSEGFLKQKFLRAGCPSWHATNSVNALKIHHGTHSMHHVVQVVLNSSYSGLVTIDWSWYSASMMWLRAVRLSTCVIWSGVFGLNARTVYVRVSLD